MILIPAIDIRGGHAVRLVQGDYDRELEFDADPVTAAQRWSAAGARWLHIVDLDGAREGSPVNLHHVERIIKRTHLPVEVGGGMRDSVAVERAIDAGADRVVIGTAALTNPELVSALVAVHGSERVMVAIDVRDGAVTHSGWRERSGASPADLAREMAERGVRGFIYTPVETDGMLEGPSLDGLVAVGETLADSNVELIYSGGIGSTEDLTELGGLGLPGLSGVIVGRALYEGRFTVSQGQDALDAG